jgi:hypothetical protein
MKKIPTKAWLFFVAFGISAAAYNLYSSTGFGVRSDKTEIVCSQLLISKHVDEKQPLRYGPLLEGINRFVLIIKVTDGFTTNRQYPPKLRPNELAQSVGQGICKSLAVHKIGLRQGGNVAPVLVLARDPKDSEIKLPGTLTFTININTDAGKMSVRVYRPDHPEFSGERGPALDVPFNSEVHLDKEIEEGFLGRDGHWVP